MRIEKSSKKFPGGGGKIWFLLRWFQKPRFWVFQLGTWWTNNFYWALSQFWTHRNQSTKCVSCFKSLIYKWSYVTSEDSHTKDSCFLGLTGDCSPADILTTTSWETLSQKHPANLFPEKPWKVIRFIVVFKTLKFWDNLSCGGEVTYHSMKIANSAFSCPLSIHQQLTYYECYLFIFCLLH